MVALLLWFCAEIHIPMQKIEGPLGHQAHTFIQNQSWFSGSVLIDIQGKIVLHQAYGWADSAKTVPLRTDSLFGIASISKQFTASALFLQIDQGKLALNDPLAKFFPNVPPDKAHITLQQLLTHTAGLANSYAADGLRDRQKALAAIFRQPLRYKVGERFGYSADGYVLAAMIAEMIAEMPFHQYLDQAFFRPAGLTHTKHWGHQDMKNPKIVAQPESWPSKRFMKPSYGFQGCTGLFSNTADLYRWYQVLMGDQILTRASREKMLSGDVPFSRGKQGYGWFRETSKAGRPTLWTRGTEDMGFSASLTHYPEENVTVVITSNTPLGDQKPGAHRLDALLEPVVFP